MRKLRERKPGRLRRAEFFTLARSGRFSFWGRFLKVQQNGPCPPLLTQMKSFIFYRETYCVAVYYRIHTTGKFVYLGKLEKGFVSLRFIQTNFS